MATSVMTTIQGITQAFGDREHIHGPPFCESYDIVGRNPPPVLNILIVASDGAHSAVVPLALPITLEQEEALNSATDNALNYLKRKEAGQ